MKSTKRAGYPLSIFCPGTSRPLFWNAILLVVSSESFYSQTTCQIAAIWCSFRIQKRKAEADPGRCVKFCSLQTVHKLLWPFSMNQKTKSSSPSPIPLPLKVLVGLQPNRSHWKFENFPNGSFSGRNWFQVPETLVANFFVLQYSSLENEDSFLLSFAKNVCKRSKMFDFSPSTLVLKFPCVKHFQEAGMSYLQLVRTVLCSLDTLNEFFRIIVTCASSLRRCSSQKMSNES